MQCVLAGCGSGSVCGRNETHLRQAPGLLSRPQNESSMLAPNSMARKQRWVKEMEVEVEMKSWEEGGGGDGTTRASPECPSANGICLLSPRGRQTSRVVLSRQAAGHDRGAPAAASIEKRLAPVSNLPGNPHCIGKLCMRPEERSRLARYAFDAVYGFYSVHSDRSKSNCRFPSCLLIFRFAAYFGTLGSAQVSLGPPAIDPALSIACAFGGLRYAQILESRPSLLPRLCGRREVFSEVAF